jgi:hypothetical protein
MGSFRQFGTMIDHIHSTNTMSDPNGSPSAQDETAETDAPVASDPASPERSKGSKSLPASELAIG